ncbi:MAG: ABC transporter ATP-binding protein [Anaerolineales bacterium]
MSSDQYSIKVENLSKCYHVYNQPQDRLKQSVIPRLQRLIGRTPDFYYHDFWALRDITFDVKKGETVGIIGRNGSGKSTLLQLICGTLTPTSGMVMTQGRIAALLELGSGFNLEFSGRENVYINGAILGLTKEEVDSRFDDIAAFADIGEFIEQPVKTYSSGMVVRLAFAVQAMVDPDILIVDEALAVGDEKFQRKCFARLEELKRQGTSILFVSHSGPQIIEICDRAMFLEGGTRLMLSKPLPTVRAYHKLIYAPASDYEKLVSEYKQIDQSSNFQLIQASTETVPIFSREDEQENDYFDGGLIPETTSEHPILGARITSIKILNEKEQQVNVLYSKGIYCIEMSGEFTSESSDIYYAIHIRSVSGNVISGQHFPSEGNSIESVEAGKKFRVKFNFNMALLPGIYFVGGGVWSYNDPNCLHRILDAIMFRVQDTEKRYSFGMCDLMSEPGRMELY